MTTTGIATHGWPHNLAWFGQASHGNATLHRLAQQCWASRMCDGPCNFSGGADLVCDTCHFNSWLCGIERHPINDIYTYLPPSAVVLELGARYGTVSCAISHRQAKSGLRLSLEPDATAYKIHSANVRANGCAGHTLLAAASRKPLFKHPTLRATSPKPSGNFLRTENCSAGCEQRKTYSVPQLADVLSQRVGHRVQFDSLVVDCEGCFMALLEDEADFLRDPILERIFYEVDERNPKLIERVCSFGFGIARHEVDCLLPHNRPILSQVVFERRAGLGCTPLKPVGGGHCPDD